jgi:hypothetical protein
MVAAPHCTGRTGDLQAARRRVSIGFPSSRGRGSDTTAARGQSRTAKDGEMSESEWLKEHAWKAKRAATRSHSEARQRTRDQRLNDGTTAPSHSAYAGRARHRRKGRTMTAAPQEVAAQMRSWAAEIEQSLEATCATSTREATA